LLVEAWYRHFNMPCLLIGLALAVGAAYVFSGTLCRQFISEEVAGSWVIRGFVFLGSLVGIFVLMAVFLSKFRFMR
jgi:hypothetical protein